ncbi:restriction endonuclease subunit S [uncultured Methanobrevibacter sp.]|uniref:restriction endonuclease subunit S n=1 Tax=uncultured Methanobrevibacter sp. TaxID=253161 RepID=UPI0025FFBEC6|nr:restriction endonuclease subunit S [uncultured Methanobrevibacter sp.]
MQQIFAQKLRFAEFDEEWKIVKLKNVGKINTGNTPSTKNKEYYTPEKYLWVTPSDISSKYILNTERKLSEEGSKKGRFVKKNSVLVTCIASIGKNCIITEDGYFNQQINSITPNKDYDYEFIYYLICYNSERMKKYAGITATPILNKKSFENMKFEFPSLNEQKKIKNTLSNMDNKIFNLENMITKTQNFKKGLLQQMFVYIFTILHLNPIFRKILMFNYYFSTLI